MREWINIVNEMVEEHGIYSKLSRAEFVALAQRYELRGVGFKNEVFVADAFRNAHLDIRYGSGIPPLYGEGGFDDPHGFDFYVTTTERRDNHDDRPEDAEAEWGDGGDPDYQIGNVLIFVGDGGENALKNRAFAYLMR